MPTITTVDATWETGASLDAAELRRADSALFLGDGSNNGVRGGIVRHGDNSLAVSVNGSDQVTVQAGAVVIPAATGLGVYRAALSAATAATAIDSRNATNPRIDLVVFRSTGAVDIVTGTPGASPSAPALPAQSIELARLSVPAVGGGAVTVTTSFRTYATSLGGTLPVETAARLPGSGNQKGQRAVAIDSGVEYLWNGTAWTPSLWVAYTPTTISLSLGSGGSIAGRYTQIGKTVHFRAIAALGTGFTVGAMGIGLPVPASTASGTVAGVYHAYFSKSGGNQYQAFPLGAASYVYLYVPGTNGAAVDAGPTAPFTWAAGDFIEVAGTYEAA